MLKVVSKGHLPFEYNYMFVNIRAFKTKFSLRNDFWHPSYMKLESFYLNNHGVGESSGGVGQQKFSVYQMICDEQLSDNCTWNVIGFSES